MSQKDSDVSRRTVLKKGAGAAAVAAGGLAATSGSASAVDYRYLRVQGKGSYHIQLYADDVEVTEYGVELQPVKSYDTTEGTLWDLEGKVDGEINSTPNDYAQFKVYGFDEFGPRTWDDGVEVFYAGDQVSE
ncbi:hypothetical protein M0R89_00985 [Halorussus limi]|uniref:Uncharacterized protein n=1 Tax=Halorussus limi TaxID=2938695 RepID=A0A8U0HUH1_9EURY|nr:hypothetical protein [Halorussus limi]UPV74660.1 hypothetical protein M0R89_00985 [Halorussus limi]